MATVSQLYQQASFRGVKFFIRGEGESGGKKTVTHNYPNSGKKFVEELGRMPPDFTFDAFVSGDDAIDNSRKLIRALDLPGIGTLVHPIYGRLEVKSTTWGRKTTETKMGEISFSLNFSTSESNISLLPSFSLAALISAAADTARGSGFSVMKAVMFVNKAAEAVRTTQKIYTTVMKIANGDIKSLSDLDPSALSTFDRVFGTNTREIYQLALSVEDLVDSAETFYNAARATSSNPADLKAVWQELTLHEIDRVPGPTDTAIRLNQETNTAALNGHTQINALINLYEAIAYETFATDEDLEAARADLDDKFELLLGGSTNNPLASDNTLRSDILDLRSATNQFLDQSLENTFNIEVIKPLTSTSLSKLVFRLYGDLDNLDTIRALNPDINHAQISLNDTVKVLS